MQTLRNLATIRIGKLCLILIGAGLFSFNVSAQTISTVTIGNVSGPGSYFYGPLFRSNGNTGLVNFSRYAYLYTASELNIPSGSKILSLEWMKKDANTIIGNNSFNVWLSNTTTASYPSTTTWNSVLTGTTQVFNSTSFSVSGAANSWLQTVVDTFEYTGGVLQILTDWTKIGFATGPVPFFTLTAPGKAIGTSSSVAYTGTSLLQASTYGNSRPTLRITYITVPPCAGTPNPGNTVSSDATVCPNIPFNLTLQNSIPGGTVSYLWQSANNASFTSGLTNLGTSSSYTATQTVDKYYRAQVTCGASTISAFSTPLFVPMSPSYGCYCKSAPTSPSNEDIAKFTFGNLSNCSVCFQTASGVGSTQGQYSNFQAIPAANVQIGASIPFSILIKDCEGSSYANVSAIFIDYNKNMSFADAGEMVYSSTAASSGTHIESGNIIIPLTASTGLTGIRVITAEQNFVITNPCINNYGYGETEDYLVNILPSAACTGVPVLGNTLVVSPFDCNSNTGTYSVCSGKTLSLSVANLPNSLNVTYQWFNNAGPIAGATSVSYTTLPIASPDVYKLKATCSGLSSFSNPVTLTMAPFIECYCASGAADDADEDIFSFTLNGGTNTWNCVTLAPGIGSILNRYSNFSPLGSLTNITAGTSVPFTVEMDDCDVPPAPYFSFGTAIWIDYNQNGSLSDPGEKVYAEQAVINGPRILSGNIIIPCNALTGQTRLRVTIGESLSGNSLTPCLGYGFGETEDYIITIQHPTTACITPIPNPLNTLASISVLCDSTAITLSLENACILSNYQFQWYQNNVAIPGATNTTYTTPKMYDTASFYARISCGSTFVNSPIKNISKPIFSVNVSSSINTYCTPGGIPVVLTSSGANTYSYNPSNSLTPTTGAIVSATPTSTTTYTVIGTDASGCTKSSTTTITVVPCSVTLNLRLFIQGYFINSATMVPALKNQGVGTSNVNTDSITVELHQPNSPYALVETKNVILRTDGTATISYPNLTSQYYLVIKHRNALDTWSAVPVGATALSYDFSTDASKAFGANQVEVESGRWALYSGELNGDGNIDLLDLGILDVGINGFFNGYQAMDISGDGNVDLLDATPIEQNTIDFVFTMRP